MNREDYISKFPISAQSVLRSLAQNFDLMLHDLKSIENYYSSTGLERGSLYKSVKRLFTPFRLAAQIMIDVLIDGTIREL